jgi:hypothetical protein
MLLMNDSFREADWQLVLTVGAVALFTLTACGGRFAARREDIAAPIGGLAVIVSAISLVGVLFVLWGGVDFEGGDDSVFVLAYGGIVWSVCLGHVSWLLGGRRATDGRGVNALLAAAVGLTVGLAAMFTVLFVTPDANFNAGYGEALSSTALFAVVATIALFVGRAAERQIASGER